jgi:peptide/nickel transport system substrate-binding protein
MKTRVTVRSLLALASVSAIAVTGVIMAPAHAATRSTVVYAESNAFTSLNSATPDTNLVTNTDVGYLTGIGFNYYNNKEQLLDNTDLGTYGIVKNTPTDFRVKYSINPGSVWSDGVPITASDMLLSHVLSSSAYSKKAGLGDPKGSAVPDFNSLNYGAIYDSHVVGLPIVSSNNMSVTIQYDSRIPDWKLQGPGISPVHALELMAAGKTSLPSVAEGTAASEKFASDFANYNTADLKKMAAIWSTGYNIKSINSDTNPLLLVCSGAFIVQSGVADQSLTMVANPKYNTGPALHGISTVVLKFVADGTPSAQALSNGELDIYSGQPTADTVAAFKSIAGTTAVGGSEVTYEHVDLRVGDGQGQSDHYTGPFAMSGGQKAKDLRTAFLLTYPRNDIVTRLVQPINANAVVLDSTWLLADNANYKSITQANGGKYYSRGSQVSRTIKALALVRKWYPTAGNGNTPISLKLLYGQPSNSRRASEAALIKAAEAKIGFDVNTTPTSGWSAHLNENKWDLEFFAWNASAIVQAGNCETFKSGGSNNFIGYTNATVDSVCKALEATTLSDRKVLADYQLIERSINADAITLGVFQFPSFTAYNSNLANVKPSPLSPNIVWNYWDWHY